MASLCWRASGTPWCWPGNSRPSSVAWTSPATSWITARWWTACRESGERETCELSVRGPTGWVHVWSRFPHHRRTTFIDTILHVIGSQVSDLKENKKYQFQVRAANIAGVGVPSLPSDTFLCEEWTIAAPGRSDPSQIRPFHHLTLVF